MPPTWNLFGADHVPFQLLLLSKAMDRTSARQLSHQYGMTLAEWRVLAYIGSSGPASAGEIGAEAGIDRAEISRAVARLSEAKLINRQPDPKNRRRLIINLTQLGQNRHKQVRNDRRAFFKHITKDLDDKEVESLANMLKKIALRVFD